MKIDMNSLSNLTVVILTYKTDYQILKNCIQSIESSVKIKIIENSSNFIGNSEIFDQLKYEDLSLNA